MTYWRQTGINEIGDLGEWAAQCIREAQAAGCDIHRIASGDGVYLFESWAQETKPMPAPEFAYAAV